jgi:hypothetical protein
MRRALAEACGSVGERFYWRSTGHELIKCLSSLVWQCCVAADGFYLRSRGKAVKHCVENFISLPTLAHARSTVHALHIRQLLL